MSPQFVQSCHDKTSPFDYVSPLILKEGISASKDDNSESRRTKVLSWEFKIHKRCKASAYGMRDDELIKACSPISEAGAVTSVVLVGLFLSWT